MLTETLKIKQKVLDNDSIVVFVLNDKTSDIKMCGRRMVDWVKKATTSLPIIEFDYNNEELMGFLKPRLVNSKFVIVLFSNTPLITESSVMKIAEYVKYKQIKACKFNGGFAFDIEYLKKNKEITFDSFLPTDTEEFMVVNNSTRIVVANQILKDRIRQRHIANGVEFAGDCEIDDQVEIGKNVVIFGGNIIKGDTIIGDNTILKEKNVVDNCVIGKDVCIASSNLENSKIEDNVFILPFCYVADSIIRKNCYIGSNSQVIKRTIRAGSKLKEN